MIEKITNQNQIARHKLAEKINELIDVVDNLQKAFESIHPYLKYKGLNKIQYDPAENVLTKTLRIDKEFAEEEMERLQKENSYLKDKLEHITDILYESKYALEEIINPSFISHEQEMAQEALDKVNAEIKAITGENNNE